MSDSSNITSRPWDNIAAYTDAEWHEIWESLFNGSGDRGVLLNALNEFEVTQSSPVGMSVDVNTGVAIVGGVWCQSTSSQTLTVAANASGATRYDLVFLHWTRTNQAVQIRVVDGSGVDCDTAVAPATNAIATYQTAGPPVTQWAIPLACLEVANGATQILDANITDLREFARFPTELGDLVDGTTVDLDASYDLYIPNGGIGVDQISTAIAGDGLSGGGGAALDVNAGDGLTIAADDLDVNVDGVTIQIVADTLSVLAVDSSHIDNRTRYVWIGASELHLPNGGAATWDAIAAHPVAAEGWIFAQAVDTYVVGHLQMPADLVTGDYSVHFVWSHSYANAALKFVNWGFEFVADRECGDDLTGGTGVLRCVNESTNNADEDNRICWSMNSGDAPYITGAITDLAAGDVLNFRIGRLGTRVQDDLLESVILLGLYFSYTGDM